MTLKPDDIVTINASDQSIKNAIEYALISWTAHYNRMGKASPYSRMEKIIVGKVSEDAVFQAFDDLQIEYDTQGKTKWYQIDQYDVGVKNHPIDIKSNFIDLNNRYFKKKLSKIDNINQWIHKFHCLVPIDQINVAKKTLKTQTKRFIFAYIEGKFGAEKKSFVVHAFWDYRWLKKGDEKSSIRVGKVKISYNGKKTSQLTIYGTTEKNKAVIERIELGKSVTSKTDFYQIFSIKFDTLPEATLTIKSDDLKLEESIEPEFEFNVIKDGKTITKVENNWAQIWLQKCKIHVAGY